MSAKQKQRDDIEDIDMNKITSFYYEFIDEGKNIYRTSLAFQ